MLMEIIEFLCLNPEGINDVNDCLSKRTELTFKIRYVKFLHKLVQINL